MINRVALSPNVTFPAVRDSKPLYLLGAALLLLVLQLLSGTGVFYALMVFALLVLSYYAVMWAGGLETLFGLSILYLVLQHVLVSQIAKVFFWEAADTPLKRPLETMGVYDVGMASIAVGVLLSNRLRRRKGPLFIAETKPNRLFWMSILCTIFSCAMLLATHTIGIDPQKGGLVQGGVLGPLKQLGFLTPLAVVSGTAYIIKSSGGRHSLGLVNIVPMIYQIAFGVISALRENSIMPIVAYGLTCIAFRYRFRLKHYGAVLVIAYIANFIVFPYALVARNVVRTGSFEKNVNLSANMIIEIMQNPFKYREQVSHSDAKRSREVKQYDYFNNPSPTLARYTLISWTDGLVNAAINQGFTGWMTITPGFEASLPRFLNPDKPFVSTGNLLAHRVRGLSPGKKDHTTGISIGLCADAFSSFGWLGITVIPCLITLCLMMVYRFLIDDRIWGNVLMLSLLIPTAWQFSEGSTADLFITSVVGSMSIGVGIAILYVLVDVLDKTTARVQYAVSANTHPRQQALQRVLTTTPRLGKIMGIKRAGPHEKV